MASPPSRWLAGPQPVRHHATRRRHDAAAFEPIAGSHADPLALCTVGDVLAAWRATERRLEALEPGSREWSMAQGEVAWLRDGRASVFRERAWGW